MRFRFNGLWRHPDFVRLWTGETISIFGTLIGQLAMQFTAIVWLHASAWQISLLAASQLVPGFAVGLAAGVWVDRLPRRPILIAADVLRALALTSVPLAAVAGVLTLGQLFAVGAVMSALTVCFNVAYEAYLPTLVSTDELVEGNSKLQATASIAEFGSFSLSGWLVQLLTGPGRAADRCGIVCRDRQGSSRASSSRSRHALNTRARRSCARRTMGCAWWRATRCCGPSRWYRRCAISSSRIIGTVILLYLYREVGFNAGVLGLIFAVGGITSLGGSFAAGYAPKIGIGRALVAALFVQSVGSLFTPLATSAPRPR